MSKLDELIERLESAPSDDFNICRHLDAEIAVTIGWKYTPKQFPLVSWQDPDGHYHHTPRPFTLSLDAALTLVPKGCWWNLSQWGGPTGDAAGSAYMAEVVRLVNDRADKRWGSKKDHPAIAICIAALRAITP